MSKKFVSGFRGIQDALLLCPIYGEWLDKGNHKQFKTETGVVVNFWVSTGTYTIQHKLDGRSIDDYEVLSAHLDKNKDKRGFKKTVVIEPRKKPNPKRKIRKKKYTKISRSHIPEKEWMNVSEPSEPYKMHRVTPETEIFPNVKWYSLLRGNKKIGLFFDKVMATRVCDYLNGPEEFGLEIDLEEDPPFEI